MEEKSIKRLVLYTQGNLINKKIGANLEFALGIIDIKQIN